MDYIRILMQQRERKKSLLFFLFVIYGSGTDLTILELFEKLRGAGILFSVENP